MILEDRAEFILEDFKELRVNRNRLIERIFIVTVVKNSFTRFVMSPEFIASYFMTTETQQTEHHSDSYQPTLQRSRSLTIASTDNLMNSQINAMDGNQSTDLQTLKVLLNKTETVSWPSNSHVNRKITSNIQSVVARLQRSFPLPANLYLNQLAYLNYEVAKLVDINIFEHVVQALKTRNGQGVAGINLGILRNVFEKIKHIVDNVQTNFSTVNFRLLENIDFKKKNAAPEKANHLCKAVNLTLEMRLNEMLVNSSKQLRDLVRYLLLAFDVNSEQQVKFDRLLPKSLYILKCEGIQLYNRQPEWMKEMPHPRTLHCNNFSPFLRKVHFTRYYARYLMDTILKGNL